MLQQQKLRGLDVRAQAQRISIPLLFYLALGALLSHTIRCGIGYYGPCGAPLGYQTQTGACGARNRHPRGIKHVASYMGACDLRKLEVKRSPPCRFSESGLGKYPSFCLPVGRLDRGGPAR